MPWPLIAILAVAILVYGFRYRRDHRFDAIQRDTLRRLLEAGMAKDRIVLLGHYRISWLSATAACYEEAKTDENEAMWCELADTCRLLYKARPKAILLGNPWREFLDEVWTAIREAREQRRGRTKDRGDLEATLHERQERIGKEACP